MHTVLIIYNIWNIALNGLKMPKAKGTLNSCRLQRQPYQLDDSLHYDIQWGNMSRQQKGWRAIRMQHVSKMCIMCALSNQIWQLPYRGNIALTRLNYAYYLYWYCISFLLVMVLQLSINCHLWVNCYLPLLYLFGCIYFICCCCQEFSNTNSGYPPSSFQRVCLCMVSCFVSYPDGTEHSKHFSNI